MPFNGLLDGALGRRGEEVTVSGRGQAAGTTGVTVGHLLVELLAGQSDLVRVDDDDVVAHVHVRGERRLVLPTEEGSGLSCQATEDDVGGVNDVPLLVRVPRLG